MLIFGAVRGGKVPLQLDGEEEFQLKQHGPKLNSVLLRHRRFACTELLTEMEQMAISSTLKLRVFVQFLP
jgi:hypothetical protein